MIVCTYLYIHRLGVLQRESLVNLSIYSPSHICMWDHTNTHTTTSTAEGIAMAMAMARKKRPPYRSSCGRFGSVVREINPPQDKTLLGSFFFFFLFLFIEEETDNWRAGEGRGVLKESRGEEEDGRGSSSPRPRMDGTIRRETSRTCYHACPCPCLWTRPPFPPDSCSASCGRIGHYSPCPC